MARHVWTVVCTRAETNPRSNNISLIDVTEQVNVSPELPWIGLAKIRFPLKVVSLWIRDDVGRPETEKVRLTHRDVDGSLRASWEVDVDLRDVARRRVIWELEALVVSAPGEQEFRVKTQRPHDEWEIVARIPLEIAIAASD